VKKQDTKSKTTQGLDTQSKTKQSLQAGHEEQDTKKQDTKSKTNDE
jgi:hypothetical protein